MVAARFTPQEFELFARTAIAIFLEAAPFLLIGSVLSALIEVFVHQERLAKWLPKNALASSSLGILGGMALPTCECGAVPIARRFLLKGIPPGPAMAYMLSAPVINPLVLLATYVAFQGDASMVLWRACFVAVPALILSFLWRTRDPHDLLKKSAHRAPVSSCHGHSHGPDGLCEAGENGFPAGQSRWRSLLQTATSEFLAMGKYLVIGCLAAAFFKTFLPWQVLSTIQSSLFVSVGVFMGLAVLLSICSEADAFVAASFVSFPAAAKLSFIALGPMVDLKLMGMYFAVFRKKVAASLILIPTATIFLLSAAFGIFGR